MASLDGLPTEAPPPGVAPNLVDSESQAPPFVVLGIFVSLSLLAVLVRIFVRFRFTKGWGWDDYTCIIAAVGSSAYAIVSSIAARNAAVNHIWDNITPSSLSGVISAQFTIFFTKLSILLHYLRLFGVNKLFASIVATSIAIIALFYIPLIGIAIGFLATCADPEWVSAVGSAKYQFCSSYVSPVLLLNASFNVVTDLWLLLLPFPPIVKLRLHPRKKLGLITVFAAGVGACAASLARLVEIVVNRFNQIVYWTQGTVVGFSIAEINIGIIVACASCFPAFFSQMREWLRPSGISKLT